MMNDKKRIQILRNFKPFNDLEEILKKWGIREIDPLNHTRDTSVLRTLKDGEQIVGRYKSSTKDAEGEFQHKYHTIYGIAHILNLPNGEIDLKVSYIDVFFSKNEIPTAYKSGNGISIDNTNAINVRTKTDNSVKINANGELVYEIDNYKDTEYGVDKYVSKVTQSSDGKINVTHADLPITDIKGADGVTVTGDKVKSISIQIKSDDPSIDVDENGGIKVNSVDCGQF